MWCGKKNSRISKKKMNVKSLPVVRSFGQHGTMAGEQVVGLSDVEEHDYELGVAPSPPMGKKKKRKS